MKKTIILFQLLFLGIGLNAQTVPSYENPVAYNDYIIEIVNGVDQNYEKLWTTQTKEYQNGQVKVLAKDVKSGLGKLKKLKDFKGDNSFKEVAVEFLTYMNHIATKDMPEFLKIIYGKDINSEKNTKRLDVLVKILDDDRPILFQKVVDVQKTFAVKFGYTIEGQ